uniref:Lipase_3 domain-containing protein n=1 Tax=Angiostrongylus cantonensis TaxID=6313 RepID=A0A0K0CXG5_ANGCA
MHFILAFIYSLSSVASERSSHVEMSTNGTPFDLSRALWALDFAAAAYAPNPTPCLMQHNAFMVYRIAVPCDYLKDEISGLSMFQCWSFVAIRDGWIIVSFRGTRTKVQLIAELIETMSEPKKKVRFPYYRPSSLGNYFLFHCFYMINLHLKLRAGGSVQRYFYVALKSFWKKLHAVIRKLRSVGLYHIGELNYYFIVSQQIYPSYQVLFTGHSLGGALASLASIVFAHRHPALQNKINLITYGQPRVGNYEYAEAHSRLVPDSWRIVHKYDLVAHLPACAFRFFSHSCTPLLNHSPYHHGTEVWFPTNMTNDSIFRICEGTPQFEDDKCRCSLTSRLKTK